MGHNADITSRQLEVLTFCTEYFERFHRFPTVRAACRHFGVTSTQGMHCHFTALAKKGWLLRSDTKEYAGFLFNFEEVAKLGLRTPTWGSVERSPKVRVACSTPFAPRPSQSRYPGPAILRRLYIDDGLTTMEVAALCEVAQSTIYVWFDRAGIKCRKQGPRKEERTDEFQKSG